MKHIFFFLIVFFNFMSLYSAWCPLRVYNNIGFMFQCVIRFIHSAADGEMAFQDVIHAVVIVLDIVSSKMPSLYSKEILRRNFKFWSVSDQKRK